MSLKSQDFRPWGNEINIAEFLPVQLRSYSRHPDCILVWKKVQGKNMIGIAVSFPKPAGYLAAGLRRDSQTGVFQAQEPLRVEGLPILLDLEVEVRTRRATA